MAHGAVRTRRAITADHPSRGDAWVVRRTARCGNVGFAPRCQPGSKVPRAGRPDGLPGWLKRASLLAGFEGFVRDGVLFGGTAEFGQLGRDHRRLVEGSQDAHRGLAIGELLADALAVGVG